MNSTLNRVLSGTVLVVVGVLVWNFSTNSQTPERPVAFSDFMADVDSGNVEQVTISGPEIAGIYRTDKARFQTYRNVFWEAGLVGQVLYLEAEEAGIRSTGIGCYFDDPVHDVFGISSRDWQSFYHFTVGGPVEDVRLSPPARPRRNTWSRTITYTEACSPELSPPAFE